MQTDSIYDIAIVGGGLAGLSSAILLQKQGYSVVLFEKEQYPFHKVCGEYISLESWNFLQSLGVPLDEMDLPKIDHLLLSAPNGWTFKTKLPLGGFGLSRYLLDSTLADIAKNCGVQMIIPAKVNEVNAEEEVFNISYSSRTESSNSIRSRLCFAAFGKRSNLDIKWNRDFVRKKENRLENYVAVKYHLKIDWPKNLIALHNFPDGYCGISKIENDEYCLCYMTRAVHLKENKNDIALLEKNLLSTNPHLRKIFTEFEVSGEFPITISQISFSKKTPVENQMLMLGDAAGMITPLCGNGMSIAFHTGKIAAELAEKYLDSKINKEELFIGYSKEWSKNFSSRLGMGRALQGFFGNRILSNIFVGTLKTFPFVATPLIRMTHGKPF